MVKALRGPGGFQPVMDAGAAARHGPFRVHMLRRDGTTLIHLGVGVAKKRVARATARNRLKRHVRESARAHAARLQGLDLVVFVIEQSAQSLPSADLRLALERLWEKGLQSLARNPRQSPGRSP